MSGNSIFCPRWFKVGAQESINAHRPIQDSRMSHGLDGLSFRESGQMIKLSLGISPKGGSGKAGDDP
jgi:hypothetical protein